MQRANVKIYGIVQGVFFRETVRRAASRYDVHGFVRNLGYDAVEIEAEGAEAVVTEFIEDVLTNPPSHARIDRVHSSNVAPTGGRGFYVAPSVR